jgi:twitching motility protein PilT
VLATVLRAVISQRLVPRADGRGRVAALEIMVSTARTRELIEDKDRTKELHDAINQGGVTYGMQSFDQALMYHLQKQLITYEEALRNCSNPDDFALKVSGISGTSDQTWGDFDQKATRPPPSAAPAAPAPGPAAAPNYLRAPPPPAAPAPSAMPAGAPPGFQPGGAPPYMQPPRPAAPAGGGYSPGASGAWPPPPVGVPARPAPTPAPAPAAPAANATEDEFKIERF